MTCLGDYLAKPVGGRAFILFIGHIDRGRAAKEVAVNRGRDKYTLAFVGRSSEYRSACQCSAFLIEQYIFTAARMYVKRIIADHSCHIVRIQTRRVYYVRRVNRIGVGRYCIISAVLFYIRYFKVQFKIRTVIHRVSHCGNTQFIRTDNCTARRIKRVFRIGRNIGFEGVQLIRIQYFKPLNAVFDTAFKKLVYNLAVIFVKPQNKRAVILIFYAKFPSDLRHHFASANIKPCFKAVRLCIKTRVDYCRICFCCAERNIIFFFQNTNAYIIFCQLSCRHCTDNTCADDCYIIQIGSSPVIDLF